MTSVKWLVWTWILISSSSLFSSPSDATQKSAASLFDPIHAPAEESVLFVRLRDKKPLIQINPTKALIPASVTKLVTSAAALYQLGPNYSFDTTFYYTGAREGFMIKGDLVVVGSGDPLLISEKLWQAAADLRHLGLRTITGNIIIDNSLFDSATRDDSREGSSQYSTHAYDAPLTAFAINFNTFTIAVAPGDKVGGKGIVELDPYPLKGLMLENQLRTGSSGQNSSYSVSRMTSKEGAERMVISGVASQNSALSKVYRSVGDPLKASGEQLRAFLAKEGIIVQGSVVAATKPAGAKKLLAIEGYPLKRAVESLNKYSNNYIADVLVKKLGAQGSQGSMQKGLEVIRDFMSQKVGAGNGFIIQNGSGLAPENRLSAEHLVNLLIFMEERFDLFPEYLYSLPAAATDGTLEDRFRLSETLRQKGLVRAKTGSLTEPVTVVSLAGYVRHKEHGLVAFAIIDNGIPGKGQPGMLDLRNRQDKALSRFLE